ncbi:putative bifunctional diguanylate cyclase/phosphodiesterase [Marinobacter sp. JSM 1782161]|uniref:putative bifunctional diguanylate cyclase/phosphodiesterase n=1 Tax=Marinobacter sp. JSM 1782161 TaxID=2685906 RepID=UPI00140250E1|nr:bifunctional diguanylate cyclase/phosphodiesterase [Marinobacter sp. JSM 1782161]
MSGTYNLYLVATSVVIAIVASYSALSITSKIFNASGRSRCFWLAAGSIVMGAGIWSMHFVGMLAFHMHADVRYDLAMTAISMAASVIASFIAFYITLPEMITRYRIALGGGIMGSGVSIMHYLGMEAMIMDGSFTYDTGLVVVSIVIALAASYAALFLFVRFQNQSAASWAKWLSAVVMGIAISGMHYTGMSATEFHMAAPAVTGASDHTDPFLLYGVIATVFVIILISWAAMFFDRYFLETMAYQDGITGLSNRNEMNRYLNRQKNQRHAGFLFLDLDHFKVINDTLGHDIGDLLLKAVGKTLQSFQDSHTQAYRIGGDEFLFIAERSDLDELETLSGRILDQIKQPFHIEGNELYVTGSIGIALGRIDPADSSALLRAADTAMYVAKKQGKNQHCVYTEAMGVKEVRKMEIEKDLQRGVRDNQFFIEYQPKWNVKTDRVFGFEALVRWNHPRLGVIPPNEFIPLAEETGLIVPLTQQVLEEACRRCIEWQAGNPDQSVAVNISPKLFQTDTLFKLVDTAIRTVGLRPGLLELEVTESMMLQDVNDIVRQLNALRELGVKISMDDFGAGYSSIGLLDTLPLDAVKLDRIFTMDIDKPSKRAIIRAIVMLAEQLGLDVIAEGVELEEDIEYLTELGCFVMQGFYYSKPLKSDGIQAWTDRINARHRELSV